jgi:hypothetical protein
MTDRPNFRLLNRDPSTPSLENRVQWLPQWEARKIVAEMIDGRRYSRAYLRFVRSNAVSLCEYRNELMNHENQQFMSHVLRQVMKESFH